MTNESQNLFSTLIREFSKLDASDKNKEIIDREKIILEDLVRYAQEKGIDVNLLKTTNIQDSSDETLNLMMIYLLNIENILNEIIGLK